MRNKTALIVLTSIVSLLCLYYLSFTFISRGVEDDASEYATNAKGEVNPRMKQAYLDSVWTAPVFNLLGLEYTYKEIKQNEVKLGLDLQGGMHVTMEVATPEVLRILSNNNQNPAFQKALKDAQAASYTSQKSFVELFYETFKREAPTAKLSTIFANRTNKLEYTSTDEEVLKYLNTEVESTIDRAFEILRTRIDKFGVAQPNIQQLQGTNRIQIELPGVDNPERVRKLLQGTAKLEFYEVWEGNEFAPFFNRLNDMLVKQEAAAKTSGKKSEDPFAGTTPPAADQSVVAASGTVDTTQKDSSALADQLAAKKDTAAKAANDSLGAKQSSVLATLFVPLYDGLGANVKDTAKINKLMSRDDVRAIFPSNMRFVWAVKPLTANNGTEILAFYAIKKGREGKAPLEGDVITEARQDFGTNGQPEVGMQMNTLGAKRWKRLTAQNIGKRIAIVLDNYVYSAPTVQGEIPNGMSSISGSFTIEEAKDLANILKAGKMPVPTRIVEEAVVGPSLGQESISQGLVSVAIGFVVIILFMAAFYSGSGLVADVAVFLNVFLILGMLVPVEAVLTLPGIAGIVLTIGMAVDANVLINERIKDELRDGQSMATAIDNGYRAASVSIWDANITTLVAGLVLLYFGSGPVKGFGTTLSIGIATSLFTSVYVTRIITEWRLKNNKGLSFTTSFSKNLFKGSNIDFVSKRKIAYAFSSIVIIGGLVASLTGGFNYGVDFKGGWSYVAEFDKNVSTTDIRQALSGTLGSAPEVKTFGTENKVQITTSYLIDSEDEGASEAVAAKVREGLSTLTGTQYTILSSSKVGPTVANDIKTSALYAVIIAMAGIFGYIWIRFRKWEYAMGATIALIHDSLVVLTFFTLARYILPFTLEIDQNFIAAVLTIVGFSVNDTVVIFDRVREKFRDNAAGIDSKLIINQALNETLSRTIITTTTVFLVVLILLVFGGETIRGLSFALLIGVIAGSYSTIYIAVPFLIDARKKNVDEANTTSSSASKA